MKIMKINELKELTTEEIKLVNGGGKWSWGEAAICFALAGLVGVGFYTLGTMQ